MRLTKIKKTYLVAAAALAAGAMICLPRFASAAVTGQCSNCHTMHNSQNGAAMTFSAGFGTTGGSATPNDTLLRGNCLQCHTGDNAGGTAVTPFVYTTSSGGPNYGTNTLAGGNFYWTKNGGGSGADAVVAGGGHDVDMLNQALAFAFTTPPGYTDTSGPAGTWALGTNPLTCAGTYGCHGDRYVTNNFSAVHGAHHTDPGGAKTGVATTTISAVANSFRFLLGVKGTESTTWEYGTDGALNSANHNEYYGLARTSDTTGVTVPTSSSGTTISISQLCAECHGGFHNSATGGSVVDPGIQGSGTTMASPWIRHPTDFDMNGLGGEYASYTTYDPRVPVGHSTLTGLTTGTIAYGNTTNGAIVMCISCHRPHGSPYADLLRWDYSGISAGNGLPSSGSEGCFTCHTTKDN